MSHAPDHQPDATAAALPPAATVPPSAVRPVPGIDRRRFLVGSTITLFGFEVFGWLPKGTTPLPPQPEPPGPPPTGPAAGLVEPGSAGLMDEQVFQRRVDEYLAFATAGLNPANPTNVATHLVRARRDPSHEWDVSAVSVESMADRFARIDAWEDTRDFDLMYLVWLLDLGRGDTATTRLDPALLAAIEERLVANRYRYDDPLPDGRLDNLWFWSENHIIINLALEFLAGERLGTKTFEVTGMSGEQHAERARAGIVEWVSERIELGFFEWHSNVYMLKNITPLLMLAELSADLEIASIAAIGLDLCLLDMAGHNHAGCYTAPRGRTYKKDKMSSLDEATFGTAKFVFDDTDAAYTSTSDGGAAYLCAAQRYRPPQAVIDMATDPGESVVRERHGVYFDGSQPVSDDVVAPHGKDFDDPRNLTFWWSLGAVGMWPLAQTGVAAANEFRLWETELFTEVNLIASINDFDAERIAHWVQARSAVINFGFLSEANTYAYRNDKVSLASVIDHRPGEMRDQAHAWQAAIDENAMVFTNHPVTDANESTDWRADGRPGYWTGEASMPRSAQFERTAVHIYLPAWDEATDPLVWSVYGYRPFTHAYVPQDHFDRTEQSGHWTVAERKGAYIALWSWREPKWRIYDPAVQATRGMVQPFDLVAEGGPDNVWLTEVGTSEVDGSLDDFIAVLTAHEPSVVRDDAGFAVSWTSPSSGPISFSSTGAFVVDGVDQSLGGFARHESPWGTVEHLATRYELDTDSAGWKIDRDGWQRKVSKRR